MSRQSYTRRTFFSIESETIFSDDMGMHKSSNVSIRTLFGDLSIIAPYRLTPRGIADMFVWTGFRQYKTTDSEHIEASIAQDAGKRTYAVYRMDRYGSVEIPTWVLHTPRKREAKRTAKELGLPWDKVESAEEAWLADRY